MDRKKVPMAPPSLNATRVIFLAILLGLLLVTIQQRTTSPSTAVLWSLACLALGSAAGFLFGVPRVLRRAASPQAAVSGTDAFSGPLTTHGFPSRLRAASHLEGVSDWLIKILIGIGLAQLGSLPAQLNGASQYIASGLGGPQQRFFAASLIIYFTIIGFFAGYLSARLILIEAFAGAGKQAGLPIPNDLNRAIAISDISLGSSQTRLTGQAEEAANMLIGVSPERLTAASDMAIWAKAQLNAGKYAEAIYGYSEAMDRSPDDPQLHLEFATVLHFAASSPEKVTRQLTAAYELIKKTRDANPILRKNVYRALTWHWLYADPPVGFAEAIKYGEEYVKDPLSNGMPSGAIWANLAAAYGQKFKWLQQQDPSNQARLDSTRSSALHAIQMALSIEPGWQVKLRMLLQKGIPKPADEDDLEVFEDTSRFRQALGL